MTPLPRFTPEIENELVMYAVRHVLRPFNQEYASTASDYTRLRLAETGMIELSTHRLTPKGVSYLNQYLTGKVIAIAKPLVLKAYEEMRLASSTHQLAQSFIIIFPMFDHAHCQLQDGEIVLFCRTVIQGERVVRINFIPTENMEYKMEYRYTMGDDNPHAIVRWDRDL